MLVTGLSAWWLPLRTAPNRTPRLAPLLVLGLAAPFLLFAPPVTAADAMVTVANFAFTPNAVAIDVGDKVTWTWSSGTHSVVEDGTNAVWCTSRTAPATACERTFASGGTFAYHCGIHPASMKGTVTVGPPPTVAITAPPSGSTVSGSVPVTGTASHPNGIQKVEVRVDAGPWQLASGTASWSASIDTIPLSNGAHTITARATSNLATQATSSVSVTVSNPAVIDLRVTAVTGGTGLLGQAPITATVRNDGNTGAASSALFEYEYKGTWRTITTKAFSVAAQATGSVGIVWSSATLVGTFAVRVKLDPGNAIPEPNEANNVGTGTTSFWTNAVPGRDLTDP